MTKRNKTKNSNGNYSAVKSFAFWGLVLSGVAGLISFIFSLLAKLQIYVGWGGRVSGICSLVAQVAFLLCVGIAAWDYVRNRARAWKTIYAVALVLAILGVIGLGIYTWL